MIPDEVTPIALVLQEVAPLAEEFRRRKIPLYLVGGIVRDLDLGVVDSVSSETDFDLTTPATPDEVLEIVGPVADDVWSQGRRFGTIGCRIAGRAYEITTHRADSYSADSRKPEVSFGDNIEDDLARRDFTINAMAIRLPDGLRVDPFDGVGALSRRVLVTPIDPRVSFVDDPLRLLRAARFMARLDLFVVPELVDAAKSEIARLSIVSVERVRDELDKLLSLERPSSGIDFLLEIEALQERFPLVEWDVVGSLGVALDAVPIGEGQRVLDVRRLVFFAMASDVSSVDLVSPLKYSNDEVSAIRSQLRCRDLIRQLAADGVGSDRPVTNAHLRRLVDVVGVTALSMVFDVVAMISPEITLDAFRTRFNALADVEDLTSFAPTLSGGELIEEFGFEPGPIVGKAVAALRERRIEVGPATAAEEVAFVGVWLDHNGAR